MSYYDDLGLPPSATADEIRTRYRELAMVAHPDHGGDPTVFRLLNEAYDVLGDPAARRAYDRRREGGPAPTPQPSSSSGDHSGEVAPTFCTGGRPTGRGALPGRATPTGSRSRAC